MGLIKKIGEEEIKEKKSNNIGRKNRREQQITDIMKESRRFRKMFRVAEEGKKAALQELREGFRRQLKSLRRT